MVDIKPGDYACVRIAGSVGKFIEVGEWLNGDGFAPYEHALVFLGYFDSAPRSGVPTVGAGPGYWVAEAMPHGAQQRKLEYAPAAYPGALWSSSRLPGPLTPSERAEVVKAALSYLGTPYSVADYFALAAHRLHLANAASLRNYVASSKHMICSQYVDACYADAGYHLFSDGRWPGYVTPLDLADLITTRITSPKR
jgi:hypothetical protein